MILVSSWEFNKERIWFEAGMPVMSSSLSWTFTIWLTKIGVMVCEEADLELFDTELWIDSTLRVRVWWDHEDIYNHSMLLTLPDSLQEQSCYHGPCVRLWVQYKYIHIIIFRADKKLAQEVDHSSSDWSCKKAIILLLALVWRCFVNHDGGART